MSRQPRLQNERGAIIIHVAIALIALLAFSSFVIDYGVMWVSRRQAQNVVDSAALAGALAFLYGGDPTQAAQHFAANNPIWGQGNSPANVVVEFSGPGLSIPPCGVNPGCIRVDAYRFTPHRDTNVITGNVLPTYFAQLVGLDAQGVRATATAETASGNLVQCLLPFAVADRWADDTDNNPDPITYPNDILPGTAGWSPNDLYEDAAGGGIDTYFPPDANGPGTGWNTSPMPVGDFGRQLILKDGAVGQFSAGWANKVDLPGSGGASDFRDDIKACNTAEVGIAEPGQMCDDPSFPQSGTTIDEAKVGCLGVSSGLTVGPTAQGTEGGGPPGPNGETDVVHQDEYAHWDWNVPSPTPEFPLRRGGVVDANGYLNMDSPRIRPIAIFDIAHYMQNPACVNQAGTGCIIRVANIVGFFVEGMCDTVASQNRLDPGMQCAPNPEGRNQVVGRIVSDPAVHYQGAGELDDAAAFLKIVRLVR